MNLDQFADAVEKLITSKPAKLAGISNIARIMDGFVFLGGPNLERYDGAKPWSLCSRISFSPATHLYFCLDFGKKSPSLADAVRKLDQNRTNNCKISIDDAGVFISTSADINSGKYVFNPREDIRLEAESFLYYIEGIEKSAIETLAWIRKAFSGATLSIGNPTSIATDLSASTSVTKISHPLNQILYGPPGTGKTHNAINHALAIIKGVTVESLVEEQRKDPDSRKFHKQEFDTLLEKGRIQFVTFHQSFSYEEFIEGLKAKVNEVDEVYYEIENGLFKNLCLEASKNTKEGNLDDQIDNFIQDVLSNGNSLDLETETRKKKFSVSIKSDSALEIIPQTAKATQMSLLIKHIRNYLLTGELGFYSSYTKVIGDHIRNTYKSVLTEVNNTLQPYVLIIDEINRGNISKIFGELITLIEEPKRIGNSEELKLRLTYSGADKNGTLFGVPANLHIIGTMNTSDKSIALVDLALRRRFTFVEYAPDATLLQVTKDGIDLQKLLQTINARIEFLLDSDHTIGHAYFLNVADKNALAEIFRSKIIPLLQEYFYSDFKKISWVLGDHDKWKKDERLRIVSKRKSFKTVDAFGFELEDEFEGKGDQLYQIDDRIRFKRYDEITPSMFTSIYDPDSGANK